MNTWTLVLIISLLDSHYPRGGASVTSVPVFKSELSCRTAGNDVRAKTKRFVEYACVEIR